MSIIKKCCYWGDKERCDGCEELKRTLYVIEDDDEYFGDRKTIVDTKRLVINTYKIMKEYKEHYRCLSEVGVELKREDICPVDKNICGFTLEEAKEKYIRNKERCIKELQERIEMCKGLKIIDKS